MKKLFVGNVGVYALGVMMTAAALLGGCNRGVETSTTGPGGGGQGGAGGEGGGSTCASECDVDGPLDGKTECDDGNPKTSDRCVEGPCGGVCAHVKVECDGADAPEIQAKVCNDGDPCTNDRCAVSSCVHTPMSGPECRTCQEAACINLGAACGPIEADCDGDGVPEDIDCGSCAEPALCSGNTCSDKCASKYGAECAAEGKPTTWAYDASCEAGSIYKYVSGEPLYCIGCPAIAGCQKLDVLLPNGVQVMCCP